MSNSIKDQISADLQKAKAEGKLRTERIREIVRTAIVGAVAEFKEGSGEIRSIVKEVVAVVLDNLKDQGKEVKEEVTASIEGVVDGISYRRREAISKTEVEVQRLQSQLNEQEKELQVQIDDALTNIETESTTTSTNLRSTIESAIHAVRDSEEGELMRKRYAQLQAQLAILKANLTARYGERYDDAKRYLDEAHTWYKEAQERAAQTPVGSDRLSQKQAEFEHKMGEAGTALARREQRVKQTLKDLWHSITDLVTDR